MQIKIKKKEGKLRTHYVGLFTSLTLLVSATPTQGITSTCDIPTAAEGQQTTLTCQFSEDLSQLNRKFKVVHYSVNTEKPENVLLCYWSSGIAHCQSHRDYAVIGNITDKLTLKVQRASSSHTGRYLCHAFQSAPESDESCNFSLKKVKSSCDIPAVIEGGNGTLSCQFGDDLSKLQMRVKVVHYREDRAEHVLLCAWSGGKPSCQAKSGYIFANRVTDNLLLEIPFVSPDHAGAYKCQLYQSSDGVNEPCNFIVTDKYSSIVALDLQRDVFLLIQLVLVFVVTKALYWMSFRHQDLSKKSKHPEEYKYMYDIKDNGIKRGLSADEKKER